MATFSWLSHVSGSRKTAGSNVLLMEDVADGDRVVTVTLYSANDVPVADLNGKCDPYFRFHVGDAEAISSTHPKNLNPVWTPPEEFSFVVGDAEVILVELWDRDKFNADDQLLSLALGIGRFGPEQTIISESLRDVETNQPLGCIVDLGVAVKTKEQFFREFDVIAWEFERFLTDWGDTFIPGDPNGKKCKFSNYNSTHFGMSVAEVAPEVPVDYEVIEEWSMVLSTSSSDEEGWQYAPNFEGNHFSGWASAKGPLSYVRRRMWRKRYARPGERAEPGADTVEQAQEA